jgi:hypothetical protein
MKSFKILLNLAVVFCIGFTACQKEFTIEVNLDPVDPPTTSDSIYLDHVYDLYDEGSGLDTQAISRIVYDNLKRVTAIIDSSMDPAIPNDSLLYFYHGTDTLPYKLVDRTLSDPSFGYEYRDSYFFYDAQKRKTQDSVINTYVDMNGNSSVNTGVYNYSYGPQSIYGEVWQVDGLVPGMQLIYKDTALVNAAGDITSSKRYKLIGGNYVLNGTSTFTYDGHASPFSILTLKHAHRMLPNGETILGEYMAYQNIISQQEHTIDAGYDFSQTFTYEYNVFGLPRKARSDIGTPQEGALHFTYKRL